MLEEKPSIQTIRLDGGRTCLDFVNTIHNRFAAVKEDYISTPERFIAWGIQAMLWEPSEVRRIKDTQVQRRRALRQALVFREALHQIFSSVIDATSPSRQNMVLLDDWIHRAWKDLQITADIPNQLTWSRTAVDMSLPLKKIALSALNVLEEDNPHRLKRCASVSACGWLFYDTSKGNKRRWCSMEGCGNTWKVKAYRARHRLVSQNI